MTQPQAQQRLGHMPEFQRFVNGLEEVPENDRIQAWEQMYQTLLKKETDFAR